MMCCCQSSGVNGNVIVKRGPSLLFIVNASPESYNLLLFVIASPPLKGWAIYFSMSEMSPVINAPAKYLYFFFAEKH